MKSDQKILALCDRVRQTAFELHASLRHGYAQMPSNSVCRQDGPLDAGVSL